MINDTRNAYERYQDELKNTIEYFASLNKVTPNISELIYDHSAYVTINLKGKEFMRFLESDPSPDSVYLANEMQQTVEDVTYIDENNIQKGIKSKLN